MAQRRLAQRLLAPLLLATLAPLPLAHNISDNLQLQPGPSTGAAISHSAAEQSPSPGAVRDLRVTLTERPLLSLNVSWTLPAADVLGAGLQALYGYEVSACVVDNSSAHCLANTPTHQTEAVGVNETHVLLGAPVLDASGLLVLPTDALRIRSNCSYKVQVRSEPYSRGRLAQTVFTVRDCAQPCECGRLAAPTHLAAQPLPDGGRNASWRLPLGDAPAAARAAHHVLLELAERAFLSNANRSVYEVAWRAEVPAGTAHSALPAEELRPGRHYRLLAAAVDERGCRGANTTLTFQQPSEEPSNSPVVWLTALLLVVLLGVVLVLSKVLRRRGATRWKRAGARRPVERVSKFAHDESHVMLGFPIHQETNILYVEKEIEDAKARGDADKFEVSYQRLTLGREIGKGAFGVVFLAQADAVAGVPGLQAVAVKQLKKRATADEVEEFLSEIATLKRVGRHPNVVTMLGCCTLKEPYCMLMEYVPCGDLLQYLRRMRAEYESGAWSRLHVPVRSRAYSGGGGGALPSPSPFAGPGPRYVHLLLPHDSEGQYIQPESPLSTTSGRPSITETEWSLLSSEGEPQTPTEGKRRRLDCVLDPKELQNFAVQIARGMAHLEKKQITHRDLAARNVLIDENKTLKISDFGLSRTGIYVNTKRKKVPLRWLSIEAMRDNLYSSKSDVWAFAIVLWEIGTLGGFPYPTVADMNLLTFLMEGKRLEKPDNCSDELYSLMLQCWSYSPDARPSFEDLVQHLDSVISRKRVYVDFSNLSPNYIFPPTEQQIAAEADQNGSQKQRKI